MREEVAVMIEALGGVLDVPDVGLFRLVIEVDDAIANRCGTGVDAKKLRPVLWRGFNRAPRPVHQSARNDTADDP